MRWTCPKCEGELTFDIEGPDYDVGLMGYSAAMCESPPDSWACHCQFTDEETEALEMEVAKEYAWNPPYLEP